MKTLHHTFASDNYAAVDPRIMQYLPHINTAHMPAYGEDSVTTKAKRLFRQEFGEINDILFVLTGTGANILSLAMLLERPYESVVATDISHVFEEETGALSRITGAQMFTVPNVNGKMQLKDLQAEVELRKSLGFHSALPKVVSIANTTEYGTCYTVDEVKQIATFCHDHNMYLHMDGCRLPNAAAALGCSLRDITVDAGVDVLSFGGAKNGLMSAEAVVVFNAPKTDTARLQKQTLQLSSKMRYTAGQFVPYLQQSIWQENATRANAMAQQLADGLRSKNSTLTQPVVTNQVFCLLPDDINKKLRAAGHLFYDWNSPGEVRFVTSWDNSETDIKNFLDLINT